MVVIRYGSHIMECFVRYGGIGDNRTSGMGELAVCLDILDSTLKFIAYIYIYI